jgi:hypothetical protein
MQYVWVALCPHRRSSNIRLLIHVEWIETGDTRGLECLGTTALDATALDATALDATALVGRCLFAVKFATNSAEEDTFSSQSLASGSSDSSHVTDALVGQVVVELTQGFAVVAVSWKNWIPT